MKRSIGFSEIMIIIMVVTGFLAVILMINLPATGALTRNEPTVYEGYWTGFTGFFPRDYFSSSTYNGIVFEAKYEANNPFSISEIIDIELIAHKTWNPNISSIEIDQLVIEILFADP